MQAELTKVPSGDQKWIMVRFSALFPLNETTLLFP